MRDRSIRVIAIAGLVLASVACRPEPPEKERPVEPQAEVAADTAATADADATELRDAIREPIERAEAVEGAVLEAAERQQDAIDAATGN